MRIRTMTVVRLSRAVELVNHLVVALLVTAGACWVMGVPSPVTGNGPGSLVSMAVYLVIVIPVALANVAVWLLEWLIGRGGLGRIRKEDLRRIRRLDQSLWTTGGNGHGHGRGHGRGHEHVNGGNWT